MIFTIKRTSTNYEDHESMPAPNCFWDTYLSDDLSTEKEGWLIEVNSLDEILALSQEIETPIQIKANPLTGVPSLEICDVE